jgi:hypothetical protein
MQEQVRILLTSFSVSLNAKRLNLEREKDKIVRDGYAEDESDEYGEGDSDEKNESESGARRKKRESEEDDENEEDADDDEEGGARTKKKKTMLVVRRKAKTGSRTPSPATTPEVKERKTIRQRIKARRLAAREQKMKTLDDKDTTCTPAVDGVDATSPVSLSSSASATAAVGSGATSSSASLGWWQRTDKKLRSTLKKLDLTAATTSTNGSQLKTSRDRSPTTSAGKSSASSSPKQPSTPRDRRGRKTGGSAIAGLNPSSATKKRQAAAKKKKPTGTGGGKKSSRARTKSKSEAEPEEDEGTTTGSNTNTEDEEVSTTDGEGGGGGTGRRRRGSRVVAEEGPEAARGMMGRLGRRWSLVCFHPSEINRV